MIGKCAIKPGGCAGSRFLNLMYWLNSNIQSIKNTKNQLKIQKQVVIESMKSPKKINQINQNLLDENRHDANFFSSVFYFVKFIQGNWSFLAAPSKPEKKKRLSKSQSILYNCMVFTKSQVFHPATMTRQRRGSNVSSSSSIPERGDQVSYSHQCSWPPNNLPTELC